jgi:hypothetical protein
MVNTKANDTLSTLSQELSNTTAKLTVTRNVLRIMTLVSCVTNTSLFLFNWYQGRNYGAWFRKNMRIACIVVNGVLLTLLSSPVDVEVR